MNVGGGVIVGQLPKTVGLPEGYFRARGIFLDCRGPLRIAATSRWGVRSIVVTQSRDTSAGPGKMGRVIARGVTVDDGAWIGSGVLLVGCHIEAGAIVAAGTVVRGQNVAPGVMVAGNPARVIARWDGEQWVYLAAEHCGFRRELV